MFLTRDDLWPLPPRSLPPHSANELWALRKWIEDDAVVNKGNTWAMITVDPLRGGSVWNAVGVRVLVSRGSPGGRPMAGENCLRGDWITSSGGGAWETQSVLFRCEESSQGVSGSRLMARRWNQSAQCVGQKSSG